jgi:hypothetical protein
MLKPQNNGRLLIYLAVGYIAFAEVLSWEILKLPLCIVVSENQPSDNHTGYETCATLHEGIMRVLVFLWDHATHDNISAAAAVVIAIFTLTLWRSTRLLWLSGERHSERQLRAYLMIDAVELSNIAIGGQPEARLTIKNYGRTPALNVTQWAVMGFQAFPLINEIPARGERKLPPRPLGPGAVVHLKTGINRALDPTTLMAIQTESHAIYVRGEIRYDDVFGKSRETDFLLFSHGNRAAQGTMASYDTGNRMT